MFVNGYKKGDENYYAVYRKTDGIFGRSKGLKKGFYSGDIRIDPAPRWNRTLAPATTRGRFRLRVPVPRGRPPET